jgi:hypothetical protein
LRRGIFVTLRLSPPAVAVRVLDYAFTMALRAVGAPRLVSTPSPCEAWLGVASTVAVRSFTEFEGIHAGAFAARCSIYKSLVSTNFTTQAAKESILPEYVQRVKCTQHATQHTTKQYGWHPNTTKSRYFIALRRAVGRFVAAGLDRPDERIVVNADGSSPGLIYPSKYLN